MALCWVPHPNRNLRLGWDSRSEEHTSELQSLRHLVCRLLLEKKRNHRRTARCRSLSSTRGGPWRSLPPTTQRSDPFLFFKHSGAHRISPLSPTRGFTV